MALAATAADVADLLGATLTDAQEVRAERLLSLAEAAISAHVPGIAYVPTTGTVSLRGTTDDTLYIPARPLTAISSVILDGTVTVSPSSYRFTRRGELVRVAIPLTVENSWAVLGGGWGTPISTIAVAYTAGPTGPDVRLVAAQLVAAQWTNPAGLRSETIGQRAASWDTGANGLTLTDDQEAILDRYKVRARSPRLGLG